MAFSPNSEVHLLNVPLENDLKNQIYFENSSDQYNYFKTKIIHSYDKLTYQRKDNYIRVPNHIDELYNCNYVMYRNNNYSTKWFYAFIIKKEYINDGCTHVYIETDVYQTWLFNVTLKPSFVEREHVKVSDDIPGKHTLPEGLETGEFIVNSLSSDNTMEELAIYVAFSEYKNDNVEVVGNFYGGIYSGMAYHMFPNTTSGINNLNEFLNSYDKGRAEAIMTIFIAPAYLGLESAEQAHVWDHQQVKPSENPKYYWIEMEKQTSIDEYNPKNKKLLTFPYKYLSVSNNSGTNVIYKYEKFNWNNTNKFRFQVAGTLTPGGSIRMVPFEYNGSGNSANNDEGINGGKFPICCWNSDTYTNWLTQNGVNIGLSIVSGIGQIAAGVGMAIASGGIGMAVGGGTALGGVSSIIGTMAQIHQQAFVPDQVKGNTNCGDVITAGGDNSFQFYDMSIKKEYAEKIDNFFEMFGYKVNQVKVPNVSDRPYWNYVKTIDINIDGAIPTEDMQKLKNMYNQGVTLWKNGNLVGDYSQNNH